LFIHTNSLDENLIVSNEVVVVLVDYLVAVAKKKTGQPKLPCFGAKPVIA
jgi:hypothetical protein